MKRLVLSLVVAGLALAMADSASAQVLGRRKLAQGDAPKQQEGGLSGSYVVATHVYPDAEDAKDQEKPYREVTVGGLLIVVIPDTSSEASKFKVSAPEAFEKLGEVRGTWTLDGENRSGGGGKMLVLYKAKTVGTHKVTATFDVNRGEPGEQVKDEFEIVVVEPEADEK